MQALLSGVDHEELDRTGATAVGPGLAIALSRGRHQKRYGYTDPNEDVVAVVDDGRSTALVVADAHGGATASQVAVESLLRRFADGIPTWDRREAVLAFHEIGEEIQAACAAMPRARSGSSTTLLLVVVTRDADGQRWCLHASIGDSAAVVVRDGAAHVLTRDRHHFLGERWSAPQVAGAMDYDQTDLRDDDVVVVVTDGYTGFADVAAIPAAVDGDAEATARRIVDLAGEAGAGDNVAVAVLLPPAAGTTPATPDVHAPPQES